MRAGDADAEQLAAAVAGDRSAFEALLRAHYDRIHGLAWQLTGSRADADDITQDVCCTLAEKLAAHLKTDPRFAGVPVIMHSSLSGMSNQQLGKSVGVDEYVPKFEAQKLSETLTRRLLGSVPVVKPAS